MSPEIYSIIALNKNHKFLKFCNPSRAFVYYKNKRLNLLNGHEEFSSIKDLMKGFNNINLLKDFEKPVVFHLFYELGHLFVQNEISEEAILAIEIHYQNVTPYALKSGPFPYLLNKENGPKIDEYIETFNKGYQHLLNGDCYQFNLTCPYEFSFFSKNGSDEIDPEAFVSKLWSEKKNCSAYGHATVVPSIKKMFLSNSPECLFQIKKKKNHFDLFTMPIKGSLALVDSSDVELKKKWQKLIQCKKNEAELFMITDLLKNDLSKIERPIAKVIKRRLPLIVPGILHQYSLISVGLSYEIKLGKIISSLFPGGSITGAPKKRVMEIINDLEGRTRGFYCGSSIVFYKSILAASINIRSSEIDLGKKTLFYGAGGGITLQSESEQEFLEMELKLKSFINIFSKKSTLQNS